MHGINQHQHKFTSARDALLFIRGSRPGSVVVVVVVVVIVGGGGTGGITFLHVLREKDHVCVTKIESRFPFFFIFEVYLKRPCTV